MKEIMAVGLLLAMACSVRAQEGSKKPILVLDAGGHTDSIPTVLFTPDGKQLISVSKDRTVRIWDVASGEMLRTLRPPIGPGRGGTLYAGAIAPNGLTLAVAGIGPESGQDPIYLISLVTGSVERVLQGHTGTISGLAFAPNGKFLGSSAEDKTARIWDLKDGSVKHLLQGHKAGVTKLAFAPDSARVATISHDGTTRIWSMDSGRQEVGFPVGHGAIAWSPNGETVATGSSTRFVRLWNPDGTGRREFGPFGDAVSSLAFTKDSQELLFTLGLHGASGCAIMNARTGDVRLRFTSHKAGVWSGALAPIDKLAASGGFMGEELFLWRTTDGSVLHRLGGQGRSTWSAGWSQDGKTIAWGNTGKFSFLNLVHPLERAFNLETLELVDVAASKFSRASTTHGPLSLQRGPLGTAAHNAVFVKEGERLVSTLRLFDGSPFSFSFLPDGRAVVSNLAGLYVFDAKSGKQERFLKGHTGDVFASCPSVDGRYILSASIDQTVRVWSPDQEDPLVSLFFAGDDWIAWTPGGYYAASPGGERLMGWQVNNGPGKMATFHPAAQFRKTLYRPDVIKRLLEAGSVAKALEIADKERGKTSALVNVADVLPPLVVVTSPDQLTTTIVEPQFTVRALARSSGQHPVVSLRLLLDGRPYADKDGLKKITNPKMGDVRESWTLQLTPGKHTIAVQAESAASKAVSEPVEVIFDASRGIKRPDDPKKTDPLELPSLYVLAIGISEYPGNLKLDYAAKDATVLGKTFADTSKSVYRKVEVKVLTDKDATRKNILQGLSWLKKQMTQRDVAIVTFAGHGDKDSDGKFYLLPVDVDTEDLLSSAIPSDLFKGALQSIPGKVVVLLDACHSGAVGSDTRKRSGASITDDLRRDLVTDDYGVVVMCSSTGKEFSLESASVGHGYFTLALVEGLSGKADYNKDKIIHLNELDLYVTNRVKELSKGRQHPVTDRPTSIRSFPLSGEAN